MPLNDVLDTAIAPVLILLKERDEAGPCNSGEPSSGDSLHGSSEQKRGKVHAQCCANERHSSFHHTEPCQGSPNGKREVLSPVAGELNAVNTRHFHHHLGIDRGCAE